MSRTGQWAIALMERPAYAQGYEAYGQGIPASRNPYLRAGVKYESREELEAAINDNAAWQFGWNSYEHERYSEGDPT